MGTAATDGLGNCQPSNLIQAGLKPPLLKVAGRAAHPLAAVWLVLAARSLGPLMLTFLEGLHSGSLAVPWLEPWLEPLVASVDPRRHALDLVIASFGRGGHTSELVCSRGSQVRPLASHALLNSPRSKPRNFPIMLVTRTEAFSLGRDPSTQAMFLARS